MSTFTPTTSDFTFIPSEMSRTALATAALGLGLVTAGLVMAVGSIGVAGGVLLAVCWFVVPPIYTVGIGFVIAVVLVPDGFTGITFAPIGLGILSVLAAPLIDRDEPIEVAIAAVTGLSVLLAVGGGAFLWTTAILPSATALLVAFAVLAYGVHRYEIVRIGLVRAGDAV